MVKSCCAIKCSNKYVRGSNISFHRFPLRNKQLLKKWVVNIRRQNFHPTHSQVICSEHFTEEDFKIKVVASGKRRKLKPKAVPTIFSFPERLQKRVKPRRPLIRHVPPDSKPPGSAEAKASALEETSSGNYVIDLEHSYSLPRSPKEVATKLNSIIERQNNYIKLLKTKLYNANRRNARHSAHHWCDDILDIASVSEF
ncbi:THAP domain-containing protein 1-like [Hemicordylus capensis]|uniref:THAP domain-containing protein 1-like n=1 Tax=Hemicordylus capensis TaxID=884348 RepID=UPI002303A682|nr:THAP domain-containing protein 1-like [Hemicordylus capensis]XP_053145015.1 THAP domain-containing protein 1-like [Hemicordylus capensis]